MFAKFNLTLYRLRLVSKFLTVVLPIAFQFVPAKTFAQSKCDEIYRSEKSIYYKWVQEHVKGLVFLNSQQTSVVEKFVEMFWTRLSYADQRLNIYVLPENLKLTDIREFNHLKGIKVGERIPSHNQKNGLSFNSGDRLFDDLRDCASGTVCAVGIERFQKNLIGFRHNLFHEVGHLVDYLLLTQPEKSKLATLFENAKDKDLFLNKYAALNKAEYFAEAIEAYFSETKDPKLTNAFYLTLTRENLRLQDSELYEFVKKLAEESPNEVQLLNSVGIISARQFYAPQNVKDKSHWIPLIQIRQEKNLCVPTSAAIVLKNFGIDLSPREIKTWSRGIEYDSNANFTDFTITFFSDLVVGLKRQNIFWNHKSFKNDLSGFKSGIAEIKDALEKNNPVIVDTSLYGGHTFVIAGYDESRQIFTIIDPFLYAPGIREISYNTFQKIWNSTPPTSSTRGAIFTSR